MASKLAKKFKSNKKRRRKSYKSNPAPKANPAPFVELLEWILPGFGGFAATKFLTRLAAQQIAKRWPKYAAHGGAIATIGTFLSSWFLAHKVKFLAKYQMQLSIGSGLATAQSLIQLYAPNKLGWIVGDPNQAIAEGSTDLARQASALAAQNAQPQLPDHLEEVNDDPRWYTYNDAYDPGRYARSTTQPDPTPPAPAPDLSDIPGVNDDELAQGVFSGGIGGN